MVEPNAPLHGSDCRPVRKGRGRWFLLLLTVVAIVATAGLGFWQLQRAAYKDSIATQINVKKMLAVADNAAMLGVEIQPNMSTHIGRIDINPASSQEGVGSTVQALVHRRVHLRGTWLREHTVYLDNRFMSGRAGFIVATPLQLADSHLVIWVQRGWVLRDPRERTRLPELVTPSGPILVQGTLMAEISSVYVLGPAASAPEVARGSRIWQNLPLVSFPLPLQQLPMAMLQTATVGADVQDGLLRDWATQDAGIAKHYGYAFQWFALCGLIMVLYVWFQFIAPRRLKS